MLFRELFLVNVSSVMSRNNALEGSLPPFLGQGVPVKRHPTQSSSGQLARSSSAARVIDSEVDRDPV